MNAALEDAEYAAVERDLQRRHARLVRYLRVRAVVGLALLAVGVAALGGAVAIAGVPLGLWHLAAVAPWTEGFGAVLAPFMPAAFGVICVRAGWAWWVGRHADAPDPGCLCA